LIGGALNREEKDKGIPILTLLQPLTSEIKTQRNDSEYLRISNYVHLYQGDKKEQIDGRAKGGEGCSTLVQEKETIERMQGPLSTAVNGIFSKRLFTSRRGKGAGKGS